MNRIGHLAAGLSLAFFGTAYAADVTLSPGDSIQAAVDAGAAASADAGAAASADAGAASGESVAAVEEAAASGGAAVSGSHWRRRYFLGGFASALAGAPEPAP